MIDQTCTTTNRREEPKPLISRDTILLLSGFLIGRTASGLFPIAPNLEHLVFTAGCLGAAGYVLFEFSARRYQAWNRERARRRTARVVLRRIERFIPQRRAAQETESTGVMDHG